LGCEKIPYDRQQQVLEIYKPVKCLRNNTLGINKSGLINYLAKHLVQKFKNVAHDSHDTSTSCNHQVHCELSKLNDSILRRAKVLQCIFKQLYGCKSTLCSKISMSIKDTAIALNLFYATLNLD